MKFTEHQKEQISARASILAQRPLPDCCIDQTGEAIFQRMFIMAVHVYMAIAELEPEVLIQHLLSKAPYPSDVQEVFGPMNATEVNEYTTRWNRAMKPFVDLLTTNPSQTNVTYNDVYNVITSAPTLITWALNRNTQKYPARPLRRNWILELNAAVQCPLLHAAVLDDQFTYSNGPTLKK